MDDLQSLQAAFGVSTTPDSPVRASQPQDSAVSPSYDVRLRSLVTAKSGLYQGYLDGRHNKESDSEASMALVCAMVLRHFTDGEIWATLEGSALYQTRTERKGERHARNLYANEIGKARTDVQPFQDDPGAKSNGRRVVAASAVAAPEATSSDLAAVGRISQGRSAEIPDAGKISVASHGFLGRYLHYATQITDAPAEAHELMAMVTLSALAGPRIRLPIATSPTGWSLCLWAMYVVNSTVGRKTTVINIAKDVISTVLGPEAMLEWEGSPQGMLQRLQTRDGQTCAFARDEFSGLMAQMNRAGHMAALPQLLIKAFDGGVLENIRTNKRRGKDGPLESDTDRVDEPYLPILAASTWDAFIQRCTIDNVLDGFLARFIFTTGAATPRPLEKQTAQMLAERNALIQQASDFAARATQFTVLELDADVLADLWQLEQDWLAEAREVSRPDAAGPAMKRLSEAVLKVAGLLAIDEAPSDSLPVVSAAHFAVALEMGERWRHSTLALIDALGSTTFMRDLEAVGATVADRPQGIPRRDLLRKHRRIRKREFDEILKTLEEREEIEVVQVETQNNKGPKPLWVYPFGHAPAIEAAS